MPQHFFPNHTFLKESRMKMSRLLFASSLVAGIVMWGCQGPNDLSSKAPAETGEFTFSCGTVASLAKSLAIDSGTVKKIDAAIVTITDSSTNKNVKYQERIQLFNSNNQFISNGILMPVGSYKLTQFALVSATNELLYGTPLTCSTSAKFVSTSLPILFKISAKNTTSLALQVIPYQANMSADFGFTKFGVTIRDTTPNVAPKITLISPTNNATYTTTDSVPLIALASDSDGTISRVIFFMDSLPLGTDSTASFRVMLSNLAVGGHQFYARAYDNFNASAQSAKVNITVKPAVVNKAPRVAITSPINNASYKTTDSIVVSATASDSDGIVKEVLFYCDTLLIAIDSVAPYKTAFRNVFPSSHKVYAIAYDNQNAATKSATISFNVTQGTNKLPSVSIISPAHNASILGTDSVVVSMVASDSDGTIKKVILYRDSALIATDSIAPYTIKLVNVPVGPHQIYAVAYDNSNGTKKSMLVNFTVTANPVNQAPRVSLTSPTNNSNYLATDSILVRATASDTDGTIRKVTFFRDSVKIAVDSISPYSTKLKNLSIGSHALYAIATDYQNTTGRSATVFFSIR